MTGLVSISWQRDVVPFSSPREVESICYEVSRYLAQTHCSIDSRLASPLGYR